MAGYLVPQLPLLLQNSPMHEECFVFFEEEIKRSRFLTWLGHVNDRAGALAVASFFRNAYPDARHCCWAYVAGPPGDTAQVGQSDDGEPHGTAGRPMLESLLHCGVGEIVAVTVRYFGGVKLGTGGLSRAYRNGVDSALSLLISEEKKVFRRVRTELSYPLAERFRRFLSQYKGTILKEDYAASVFITAELAEDVLSECRKVWEDISGGKSDLLVLE